MKIERINENQIRCTLSSDDLSMRNLNLGELAYGSEKARGLFGEMMQKAYHEVGFEAEDVPLMVEAIPLSNESIMLVITKIDDPEELDTRFSKFSPFSEEEQENKWGGIPSELLEGAESFFDLLKKDLMNMQPQDPSAAPAAGMKPDPDEAAAAEPKALQTRIYRFGSLDRVMDAAKAAGDLCTCPNTLYKRPANGQYYLVLRSEGADPLVFSRLCNMLAEYAEKIRQEAGSEAYYQEHYEVIVKEQALQKLMKI